ncbi:MAG: tetratricopeptide repeat protein [Litorilinea sp.]
MTAPLEIHTLGPYRIMLDGQPLTELTSRTAEALLIYLIRHTRPVARDVLADFFWDERDSARAAANLRTVLTMLRKCLGDYLIITRRTVAFNHAADYWLDLHELERGMAQLAPRLAQAEPPDMQTVQQLDATLTVVQGEFLEGFHLNESRGFEAWLTQTQNQVRRLAEDGLSRLVAACLHHGEYRAGVEHADRLLTLDPYNEAVHQQVMWLLARSGQRGAALAHYAACQQVLEDELGIHPDIATRAVYRRILALPATSPCRLPTPPTPFIGRSGEAEAIARRLAGVHCRLLTLLGPGGMGKTRLALRAAEWMVSQGPGAFLDGVCFVSLAAIESADAFAVALADALELSTSGNTAPLDLVRNHLRAREMLLILDNAELLAPHDEFITQLLALLAHAPHIKLLVTSRLRLNVQEEWIYDVGGLDYPTPDAPSELPESGEGTLPTCALHTAAPVAPDPQSYGAGRLFVEHAARLQRVFHPAPDDAEAILRICTLLDGQPLGLELAAAWTRTRTCTEIAAQIAGDLDFLETTLRNVPARQRGLRAVFDFSWSLLSEAQQLHMERLAVFVGSVAASTAAQVVQVSARELQTLADHSLVRFDAQTDTFMMHDSIRLYALEKLAAAPARELNIWRAYCAHYSQLVAEQAAHLHKATQLQAHAIMQAAHSNLRAAWLASVQYGWWELTDAMLDGLYWYLWHRSAMYQAHTLLTAAHTALAATASPLARARLESRLGDCCMWLGDYAAARTLAQDAAQTLRAIEAWRDLAWVYDTLGQLEYITGNYGAAAVHYEAALRLFRREEYPKGIAQVLSALANVLCDGEADYVRARQLYAESLVEYQLCGDLYGQAKVTINLGALDHSLGQHAQAVPYYEEGIELCRTLGHHQTLAIVLNNMGQVQHVLGNRARAIALLEESADLRRALGDPRGLAFTLLSLANVAAQGGELAQAKDAQEDTRDYSQVYVYASEALELGLRLGAPAVLADILVSVAGIFAGAGQVARAAHLVQTVLADPGEGEELRQKAEDVLAQLQQADDPATAMGLAQARGQTLSDAASQALRWLKTPAPRLAAAHG